MIDVSCKSVSSSHSCRAFLPNSFRFHIPRSRSWFQSNLNRKRIADEKRWVFVAFGDFTKTIPKYMRHSFWSGRDLECGGRPGPILAAVTEPTLTGTLTIFGAVSIISLSCSCVFKSHNRLWYQIMQLCYKSNSRFCVINGHDCAIRPYSCVIKPHCITHVSVLLNHIA